MCSSLMDHNDSPGSTTKGVVPLEGSSGADRCQEAPAGAPFSSVVVVFCVASTVAVPVSSWASASSWAWAMPGSPARIANAANATSAAIATPASTIPTYPLSLLVLKMFPPYSERDTSPAQNLGQDSTSPRGAPYKKAHLE